MQYKTIEDRNVLNIIDILKEGKIIQVDVNDCVSYNFKLEGDELYQLKNNAKFSKFRKYNMNDFISCYVLDYEVNLCEVSPILEWYEDIPEHGILCWVWDDKDQTKTISQIVEYNGNREYSYVSAKHYVWKHAKPITIEEVKKYIFD